ncbi:VIT1/CCC1 transporter family protein [candidate division KSB1 bacterium]
MESAHKQKDKHIPHRYNPDYIHHRQDNFVDGIGQVVFGLQDGMVSTLGAITGVAIGSGEPYIILLAGIAIVSVESISMGIGAYVSSHSEKKIIERMVAEEREEIQTYPAEEHRELEGFFIRDGWPHELAQEMATTCKEDPELMLAEMSYRELGISSSEIAHPARNGVFMFLAYIVGGFVPLSAYFFLPITTAIGLSIVVTLVGLFLVGAGITHYTKQPWFQNGMHMFFFGGVALVVGLSVGVFMRIAFGV